ncbi:hypothetical protein ASE48_06945 [Mycobacterium sp. Root265]|uniref:endonuclease domain-containing protein n=1 Tax=Mycobacterium sp. Root265 TaxID=1736504 RepID=UPI00070B20C2|nr:DUF559 domain-containing protein [Mycobacterium sp. Root265]KRD09746.1 hypothetical protein ASE48_06945 [Mycobacterium sp. Root265]
MGNPRWPFLGTEARAQGLVTDHRLRTAYVAVHRNVYVPRGVELDATDKAVAAWLRSGRRGVLAGLSAGALHNMRWIDANLPAELNRQSRDKVSGIVLHSDVLAADEICQRRGMPTTTAARTAFDIGRIRDVQTAVIRLDALRNATRVSVDQIDGIVARYPGARRIRVLREAVALSDSGAESPQETRTRLLLLKDKLPTPRTQIEVYDDDAFVARLDMGWPEYKVAVEFDGAQHWTDARQRSRDIDRIAELERLGWIVIRVSAEMLRARPHVILRRVRQALIQRGLVVEKSA